MTPIDDIQRPIDHCWKCGYPLTALGTCPECGSDLADNDAKWLRRQRRRAAVRSLAFLAVAAVLLAIPLFGECADFGFPSGPLGWLWLIAVPFLAASLYYFDQRTWLHRRPGQAFRVLRVIMSVVAAIVLWPIITFLLVWTSLL